MFEGVALLYLLADGEPNTTFGMPLVQSVEETLSFSPLDTCSSGYTAPILQEMQEVFLLQVCCRASVCGRRTSIGCKRGIENWCSVATGTFLLLKNATTATSHPVFETSKSPLRKSPNLQIANPLYLCRFPDDSGRQATTDYSGLNPTLSSTWLPRPLCRMVRRSGRSVARTRVYILRSN